MRFSRAVVCACTAIMQCGTNEALRVTSKMLRMCCYCVSTVDNLCSLNCLSIQNIRILFCCCNWNNVVPRSDDMAMCMRETPCVLVQGDINIICILQYLRRVSRYTRCIGRIQITLNQSCVYFELTSHCMLKYYQSKIGILKAQHTY